ncbi:MAG TPA: SET domain-containing protein-lysine N-methyltransferase [Candidatus Acidoferrales bacterium]|nr:SET domain-containing protein-lysine N-methyltransferase [Candidatus Acidoferrales bacterium]
MADLHLRARRIDPPVSRFRLQIRPSPIHRLGVFAREAIPPRRVVMEYAGERINYAEAQRRFRKRRQPDRICFARLNRYWIIDGWKGNGSEFINHSCDPNLYVWRPRGHLFFCSRKRISPGEELTFDYYIQRTVASTPCDCGSAKCRGEMNRPPRKQPRRRKSRRR